ncbi:MAG: DUF5706 domain-containing protein [Flavobacteriaceae bacterium]
MKLDKPINEKLYKYDARGIQTLFRTVSKNHYNLLKMVDNKARIVLTVNSIITSLLFGIQILNWEAQITEHSISIKILVICSMLSMVFAIASMLPHRYIGKAFKESGYKGTLYAENFSNQTPIEFKNEFDRIMSTGKTVYDELILDLYFLGKTIALKQRILLLSVIVFMIGLILTIANTLLNN